MCEFSANLVSWLDGELALEEAAVTERHLESCQECSTRARQYRELSVAVAAFCEAELERATPKRRWPLAGCAAAAAVVLILFAGRTRPVTMAFSPWPAPPAPAIAFQKTPVRVAATHPQHSAKRKAPEHTLERIGEPAALQIALPADAMFPPGAVPEGFEFVANVSVTADGSLAVYLRP